MQHMKYTGSLKDTVLTCWFLWHLISSIDVKSTPIYGANVIHSVMFTSLYLLIYSCHLQNRQNTLSLTP